MFDQADTKEVTMVGHLQYAMTREGFFFPFYRYSVLFEPICRADLGHERFPVMNSKGNELLQLSTDAG